MHACMLLARANLMADIVLLVKQRRKSGIPTGNVGEYFVMGELLRRGYDAQLADRNTTGYDILVGGPSDQQLRKVQVKTVRAQPWYVKQAAFVPGHPVPVTIYVLLGPPDATAPVRYFIAPNAAVARDLHVPANGKWNENGFMALKSLLPYENEWECIFDHGTKA
jgi:hypothetical protein